MSVQAPIPSSDELEVQGPTDAVLVHGDAVGFSPNFGQAVVIVRTGALRGSGPTKVRGKKVCVEGDEGSVEVAGCGYFTSTFTVPGAGTLKVKKLADDQLTRKLRSDGRPVMLQGKQFEAVFEVDSAAKMQLPNGSMKPDDCSTYDGSGWFSASQTILRET